MKKLVAPAFAEPDFTEGRWEVSGEMKLEGNTVSWGMSCTDKLGTVADSTGSATYAGATFEATMHTVTTDINKNKTSSNMTLKGERTGECKAK